MACWQYLNSPEGRKAKHDNQRGYQDVRLHFLAHVQAAKANAIPLYLIRPAARMSALAEAVAPAAEWVTVGLRPGGEKMAERLLTAQEVHRAALDPRGYYVVRPETHEWTDGDQWTWGLLPTGFEYTSDQMALLDAPALRAMLVEVI